MSNFKIYLGGFPELNYYLLPAKSDRFCNRTEVGFAILKLKLSLNPAVRLMIFETNFIPHYQLQYNCCCSKVSAEILMRPLVGYIADAIKLLEASGQIVSLDCLALFHAVKFMAKFNLPASVNFSAVSFATETVVSRVLETDLCHLVKLELTENQDLSEEAIANIIELKGLGYSFSLDDFGTQFNGLNRLRALPFDEVKLDIDLIKNLPDPKNTKVVKHAIALAHDLGCTVVAEGVETQAQIDVLCSLKCDRLQGFYLHKPTAILETFGD